MNLDKFDSALLGKALQKLQTSDISNFEQNLDFIFSLVSDFNTGCCSIRRISIDSCVFNKKTPTEYDLSVTFASYSGNYQEEEFFKYLQVNLTNIDLVMTTLTNNILSRYTDNISFIVDSNYTEEVDEVENNFVDISNWYLSRLMQS